MALSEERERGRETEGSSKSHSRREGHVCELDRRTRAVVIAVVGAAGDHGLSKCVRQKQLYIRDHPALARLH
eukprot:366160-Chlamydomonas_euryale.AAC.4